MSKKGIARPTQSINFRDLVVGLGILVTIVLIYWMREVIRPLHLENSFF